LARGGKGAKKAAGAAEGVIAEAAEATFKKSGRTAARQGSRRAARDAEQQAAQDAGRAARGPQQVTRVPAPKSLPAFPGAQRARPKTSVQGGGGLRPRWKDRKGNIYEWDSQHGKVEAYDKQGKHKGEFDPDTGAQTKPADPTRSVEP
jgi:hypothetical protein